MPARLRGWRRARVPDAPAVRDTVWKIRTGLAIPRAPSAENPPPGTTGEGLDPTSFSNAVICIDNAGWNAAGLGGAAERAAARQGLEIAQLTNVMVSSF